MALQNIWGCQRIFSFNWPSKSVESLSAIRFKWRKLEAWRCRISKRGRGSFLLLQNSLGCPGIFSFKCVSKLFQSFNMISHLMPSVYNIHTYSNWFYFLSFPFTFRSPALACTAPKNNQLFSQLTVVFTTPKQIVVFTTNPQTAVFTANYGQLSERSSWYWPGQEDVSRIPPNVKPIQAYHAESAWAGTWLHPRRGDTWRRSLLLPCCYPTAQSAWPLHQAAQGKNNVMVIIVNNNNNLLWIKTDSQGQKTILSHGTPETMSKL